MAAEIAPHIRERIDDWLMMAVLVPLFGLSIPHLTGLFGPIGLMDARLWWGHLWFVGGALVIYGANRTLLFAGRMHATWFAQPIARLVLLATGIVFGTLPPTQLMLYGWSALAGRVIAPETAALVCLTNIVCVLFVTWLYETLFLIGERIDDHARLARIEAQQARAELAALSAQVDPHFLFNALNTLAALTESRPADARRFIDRLAHLYRGLLDTNKRPLLSVEEDLALARSYAELLGVSYGDALDIRLPSPAPARGQLPAGATQLLLENAVKHNRIDPDEPLCIDVALSADALVVSHPHRPRGATRGAGIGLANLDERVYALCGRRIAIRSGERFCVSVPLVDP